jgi:hypothetical protein
MLAGRNPYNTTTFLNWPPLWMQLIFLFKKASLFLHVPFNDIVRAFLIVTENAVALLLYLTVTRYAKGVNATKLLIFGIALNPVSVYQVCLHCNFDMLVGFWVLLAVYMLMRFEETPEPAFWLCACFALGMGAATKTIPIGLWPLLLLRVSKTNWLEKFLGGALLFVPIALGVSVLYVLGPQDIQTKVLSYRSVAGAFGFSGLFAWFHSDWLFAVWPRLFEVIYGVGSICVAAWLWSRKQLGPRKLTLLASAFLIAIPALGPGNGLQYVCWFLPLLVLAYGLGDRNLRAFLLVMYGVAAIVYTILYGFNFDSYGGFFMEYLATARLLQFGEWLSTKPVEMLVSLPLWILYLVWLILCAAKMKGAPAPAASLSTDAALAK